MVVWGAPVDRSDVLPNIISLGSNCRTRFHIERVLRARYPDVSYPTFFWDWLDGGGAKGVIWCLKTDFALCADDFTVHRPAPWTPFVPLHGPSGFVFHHDFGGASDDGETARVRLSQALEAGLSKFRYLAARTRSALMSDRPLTCTYFGPLTPDDVQELSRCLAVDGQRRFLVNLLTPEDATRAVSDDRLITLFVDDLATGLPHPAWQGNHRDWDLALARLPLSPDYHR